MMEIENIAKKIRKNITHLEEKYKVKAIGIFGSYVSGANNPDSDLDILVEFEITALSHYTADNCVKQEKCPYDLQKQLFAFQRPLGVPFRTQLPSFQRQTRISSPFVID